MGWSDPRGMYGLLIPDGDDRPIPKEAFYDHDIKAYRTK